ncbi:metal-dependent hydrolase [Thermoplasmatales archaeon SW_10_69_26]|nr:MAG: metal-dependent hydrolase [Thermoplasmatales archaeon SW_10_69_26]
MSVPELPILDDHMHLSPDGKGVEAVKEFERAGGTHLVVIHKPADGLPPTTVGGHRGLMEQTITLAEEAEQVTDVETYVSLGPHPAEFTKSLDGDRDIDEAAEAYQAGLEAAEDLLSRDRVVALGEIGRPHYEVPDDVWETANEMFREGLQIAAENDVAAILHTEPGDRETFAQWAEWAEEAGLDRSRVVKHFSPPIVDEDDNHGLVPSIIASEDNLEAALEDDDRFMMETDYLDDPSRPGAVLGPKLVPRRTHQLYEAGLIDDESWRRIHVEVPRQAYGIQTDA